MYEDSPEDMVFEEFSRTLWEDHPLGSPTLGHIDTVGKFSRDDLLSYINDYYKPDLLTIAAAGHFRHADIVRMVETNFGHMSGKSKSTNNSIPKFFIRNKVKFKDCEQVYVCTGGRGVPQKDDRKFVFFVLDSILGGSMSSRLFQEVREKRGLVYTISTFTNSYCDSAQFGIFACTSKENLTEVMKVTNGILDDILVNGVTEKEVIRAKEQIRGSVSLALESTSNRMIRLNKSELYHNRIVPIEEVIKKVEAVTIDQVNTLARDILDRTHYSTTVLGPVEDNITERWD